LTLQKWSQFHLSSFESVKLQWRGSKANIGGGFEKTYQPIVEAFDCLNNILFKVTDCSDHPQIPWGRASDKSPPPHCAVQLNNDRYMYCISM